MSAPQDALYGVDHHSPSRRPQADRDAPPDDPAAIRADNERLRAEIAALKDEIIQLGLESEEARAAGDDFEELVQRVRAQQREAFELEAQIYEAQRGLAETKELLAAARHEPVELRRLRLEYAALEAEYRALVELEG